LIVLSFDYRKGWVIVKMHFMKVMKVVKVRKVIALSKRRRFVDYVGIGRSERYSHLAIITAQGHYVARMNVARPNVARPNGAIMNVARPMSFFVPC
jgi:hypothetical protein